MSVAFREWHFVLVDAVTGDSIDDDSGQLLVLNPNAPTAPTVYSDDKGTAVANAVRTPFTFSNGRVRFWTARATTSVDLVVMTAKGQAYFLEDVPYSRHRIFTNSHDRHHVLVIPFGASNATEVDTGMDLLPANLLIKDAHMRVTTIDAGKTLDWGILSTEAGGSASGFMVAQSVASLGHVTGYGVVTNGSVIDFITHTSGYGALLKQGIAGADAVATCGGVQRRYYQTDGVAKSISYTGSSGSTTAAGYLYLEYARLL